MSFLLHLLLIPLVFVVGGITENCLTWAARMRLFYGGKILVRKSLFADDVLPEDKRSGFGYWLAKQVPHFLWADVDGHIYQYTVKDDWREKERGLGLFGAWLALWFYDGQVVKGDSVLGDMA